MNRLAGILLLLLAIALPAAAGPAYPLKISASGKYLVDQNNKPFFLQGDSPWSLMVACNAQMADQYFSNQVRLGFNTMLANLPEHKFSTNAPYNIYGVAPFTNHIGATTNWDMSSVNPDYFTNVDDIIIRAGKYGIQIALDPDFGGKNCGSAGWCADMQLSGSNALYAYGQFLGNRYASFTNIMWLNGGDNAMSQSLVNGIFNGIYSKDTNHLAFCETDADMPGFYYTGSWNKINTVYTWNFQAIQNEMADEYRTSSAPAILVEAMYESTTGNFGTTTPIGVRNEEYWAAFDGGCGAFYGQDPMWSMLPNYQTNFNTPGAVSMLYAAHLMASRPWYNCVPDTNHTVATSGYGTFGATTFAPVMREATGKTVMAYFPNGNALSMVVDMTKVSGTNALAWWFNPTNGVTTNFGVFATTGTRTFTPPNSGDWILVLDDSAQWPALPTLHTNAAFSVNQWDILAAVGAATNGEYVIAPVGTAEWTNNVAITNAAITLQGSGIDQSIIQDSTFDSGGTLISMLCIPNRASRLTGFTLQNLSRPSAGFNGAILVTGSNTNGSLARVDHMKFSNIKNFNVVWDSAVGVVDHNQFYFSSSIIGVYNFNSSYNGQNYGDGAWSSATDWNGTNWLVIEDNFFTNSAVQYAVCDSYRGAKWIFRHNTVYNGWGEAHGTESGQRFRGTRATQINNNTMTSFFSGFGPHNLRSGSTLVFSNTLTGYANSGAADLVDYRTTAVFTPWGGADGTNGWDTNYSGPIITGTHTGANAATALTDSTASWTVNQWVGYQLVNLNAAFASHHSEIYSNSANTLYVLANPGFAANMSFNTGDSYQIWRVALSIDQCGLGQGDLLTGDTPTARWLNQQTEPCYQWSNTLGGSLMQFNHGSALIVQNVHYFDNTPKPGFAQMPYPHPMIQTPDPFINTQPQNQTVYVGQSATFTVSASGGSTLHYQWTFNGSNVGTDSATYTRTGCVIGDNNGSVAVVVTDTAGNATSTTAILTVNADPGISVQPQNQSVTVGQTATFTVTASGATTLHYQWTFNGSNVGTDSSTYARANCQLADNGGTVQVTITDTAGSLASSTATLSVTSGGGGGGTGGPATFNWTGGGTGTFGSGTR